MITMPRPTREVVLQPTREVVRRHTCAARSCGNAARYAVGCRTNPDGGTVKAIGSCLTDDRA